MSEVTQALKIVVPSGVHVVGTGEPPPALQKSLVHYCDADGVEGPPRPLHGLIHDRRAREGLAPGAQSAVERQEMARNLNLNKVAEKDLADPGTGRSVSTRLVCRHLVLNWLRERHAHQMAKLQGHPGEPQARVPVRDDFPYEPFASRDGIERLTPASAEQDFKQMLRAQADGLVEIGDFGAMLAQEFARMPAGAFRHFAVTTDNHVLGVELRVKERWHGNALRKEFVVNLYDPNSTATHQRLVVEDPSQLGGRKLADWIGEGSVAQYFDDAAATSVATFFAWPPPPEAGTTGPATFVSEEGLGSAQFVQAAMAAGSVGQVRQAIGGLVSRDPGIGARELEKALTGRGGVDHPAFVAMHRGRADAVAAFVHEVHAIPDDQLDRAAKRRIFSRENGFSFHDSVMHEHPDVTAAYLRAVLALPPDAVQHADRLELLGLRNRVLSLQTLKFLADGRGAGPALDAARGYAREILTSDLPDGDKARLFGELRGDSYAVLECSDVLTAMVLVLAVPGVPDSTRTACLQRLGKGMEILSDALRSAADPLGLAPELDRLRAQATTS